MTQLINTERTKKTMYNKRLRTEFKRKMVDYQLQEIRSRGRP
jgi:hypothetical protein